MFRKNGTFLGGGVLIAPDAVLTVSHAINKNRPSAVIVGNIIYRRRNFKAIYVHADKDVDLAVIRLGSKSTVPPLKMATSIPTECTPVTIIGRGASTSFQKKAIIGPKDDIEQKWGQFFRQQFDQIRRGTMTYVPSYAKLPCLSRIYGTPGKPLRLTVMPKRLTLYGYMGAATCFGDSGGPVFVKNASGQYELVGIVSATQRGVLGRLHCTPDAFGFTTSFVSNVPAMRQWIMDAATRPVPPRTKA